MRLIILFSQGDKCRSDATKKNSLLCCSRKISLFFRNANASALRKACHFLRWEVVNDAAA